jgi:hypothetical protein
MKLICEFCRKEMEYQPGFTGVFHVSETDAMNCFRAQRQHNHTNVEDRINGCPGCEYRASHV